MDEYTVLDYSQNRAWEMSGNRAVFGLEPGSAELACEHPVLNFVLQPRVIVQVCCLGHLERLDVILGLQCDHLCDPLCLNLSIMPCQITFCLGCAQQSYASRAWFNSHYSGEGIVAR